MSGRIGRHCVIDESVEIPDDVEIGHFSVIGAEVVLQPGVCIGSHCIIDEGVEFRGPCRVWNWVHIREYAQIGVNVSIGDLAHIGPKCRIGHNARIGNGAQLHHPAQIGERAWIGPAVFLSNDPYPNPGAEFSPEAVRVGDGVIIGACAQVLGGVRLGEACAVGMGATVTRDVAPGAIVYGCPARFRRDRELHYPGTAWEHYGPLDPMAYCPDCDRLLAPQFRYGRGGER